MNPIAYLQGVVTELRKVNWPTSATVTRHFMSVVIGVALATAIIAGMDYVFINLLGTLIK